MRLRMSPADSKCSVESPPQSSTNRARRSDKPRPARPREDESGKHQSTIREIVRPHRPSSHGRSQMPHPFAENDLPNIVQCEWSHAPRLENGPAEVLLSRGKPCLEKVASKTGKFD